MVEALQEINGSTRNSYFYAAGSTSPIGYDEAETAYWYTMTRSARSARPPPQVLAEKPCLWVIVAQRRPHRFIQIRPRRMQRRPQHRSAALHLGSEVNVAGRINDGDAMVVPKTGGCGGDGDAALAFLRQMIHDGCAVVNLAHRADTPGVEEDAFGEGCFASINVGDDADGTDAG